MKRTQYRQRCGSGIWDSLRSGTVFNGELAAVSRSLCQYKSYSGGNKYATKARSRSGVRDAWKSTCHYR